MCYGLDYYPTAMGPEIADVLIKDPWDGAEKVLPADQLAAVWIATIAVRVAPEPRRSFVLQGQECRLTPTFEVLDSLGACIGRVWYVRKQEAWYVLDGLNRPVGPIPKE